MVILGADLSYSRTGLVWLDTASNKVVHYQTMSIPTGSKRMLRATKLFNGAVINGTVNHVGPVLDIGLVVIEGVAFNSPSRTTLVKLAELTGIFKFVLESHGIDYLLVSPTLIKKWVTGSGNAEKHVVAREIKRKYHLSFDDDKGNDLSDALALALWGANR